MDKQALETKLHFSQPIRQIIMMMLAIGLASIGLFVALNDVIAVVTANLYLNGFIFFVFCVGIISCFVQVFALIYSVRWIENFARDPGHSSRPPQILAPLATLLRSRGSRMQIAASSTRSILDSVATRIEEAREITRYIVNLLIFLGLLGTFYGLATTVPSLVETIRSLAPEDGESGFEVFNRLMNGLEGQLSGMGVAFSSSLLGLAGSLLVGLLELFAGHGQNRFYRELEEWLSSITRLGFSSGDGETSTENALFTAVLDQMSEQMDAMRLMFEQSDETRTMVDGKIGILADNLSNLTVQLEQSAPSNSALERVAAGQEKLLEVLGNMEKNDAVDAESRMRLRSIDVQMLHLMEDLAAGRQETIASIRADVHALTNALVQTTAEIEASGKPRR
ncbi:MAG: biopolymer transporter ExbB [Rhodobacteraceae bacterium]|jgi:hypothetical protein|nr:biopolymer transporter ExbB [Paracoccaceae bacterium]